MFQAGLIKYFRDGKGFEGALIVAAVLYLLVFAAFPFVYTVIMSFQQVDMFTLGTIIRPFNGIGNYTDLFSRPEFSGIVWNTVLFVVLSIAFQLAIGFGLALFFLQDFPGASYIRGLFLAGWILPALVVGAVWRWIFAGDFGILNYGLQSLGLIDGPLYWLSNPDYSLYSVIIANIWLGVPFNMLLLSVGLAGIPRDIYEAAEMDGAGAFQRFRSITLPLMGPTLGAVISLGVVFTLQQFDLVAALTQGGPANSSNVAQYWSWQMSFQTYEISAGATMATMMIALVIIVAVLYVRSVRRENSY
jgi:multiple sugar transport system permease protein